MEIQFNSQKILFKTIYEDFLQDAIDELIKYGDLEEVNVCDNICEHLSGNVYLKYRTEEDAQRALKGLAGRFYAGRTMVPEFSPVTDYREARCRQFETSHCSRGGMCNFMHLKKPREETKYFIMKPFKNSKKHLLLHVDLVIFDQDPLKEIILEDIQEVLIEKKKNYSPERRRSDYRGNNDYKSNDYRGGNNDYRRKEKRFF